MSQTKSSTEPEASKLSCHDGRHFWTQEREGETWPYDGQRCLCGERTVRKSGRKWAFEDAPTKG
jgi:hypothetical protein